MLLSRRVVLILVVVFLFFLGIVPFLPFADGPHLPELVPEPLIWRVWLIERDICIDIAVSSLFTLLTIGVIDRLLAVQQNHEWRLVRNRMNQYLRNNIDGLLTILLNLCESKPDTTGEALFSRLVEQDKITLRNDILEYFVKDDLLTQLNLEGYIEWLEGSKKHFHDVRVEYFKFIDHEMMASLQILEEKCGELLSYFKLLKRVDFLRAKEHEYFEKSYFQELVAFHIHDILKEIQKLRNSGFKIQIPKDTRFSGVVPWDQHLESIFEEVIKYEPAFICRKCDKPVQVAMANFCPHCGTRA